MDPAHGHLILNHVPVFGTFAGLALVSLSLTTRSRDEGLFRGGLFVLVLVALVAVPVHATGFAAMMQFDKQPEMSAALIARHQDAAFLSSIFLWLTGGIAWFELWQRRRTSRAAEWNIPVVLILSMATLALMGWTANLGGQISHVHIRTAIEGSANEVSTTGSVAAFMLNHRWVWPLCEILHFAGLCLLFGVVLLLNLQVLGVLKKVSFLAWHSLLPWAVVGFGLNLVTGLLFLMATPEQYVLDETFFWKIGLMTVGGFNALYFTVYDAAESVDLGRDATLSTKAFALSATVLLIGVAYLGRMLPYLGEAF